MAVVAAAAVEAARARAAEARAASMAGRPQPALSAEDVSRHGWFRSQPVGGGAVAEVPPGGSVIHPLWYPPPAPRVAFPLEAQALRPQPILGLGVGVTRREVMEVGARSVGGHGR